MAAFQTVVVCVKAPLKPAAKFYGIFASFASCAKLMVQELPNLTERRSAHFSITSPYAVTESRSFVAIVSLLWIFFVKSHSSFGSASV
jgi:hypothetical protein